MSVGKHLFTFRTEKLSPLEPMILLWGKVGNRQFKVFNTNTATFDVAVFWYIIQIMSRWSARRQLSLIGIVLIVIFTFVLIFTIQLVNTPPTCFDGKQNGDETGIDVGGSCPSANPIETRSVVVLWARPFLIADDVYAVAAYFENQNFNRGIQSVPYRFRVYDVENILIAERYGETFFGPNQRSAIVETAIKVGNRTPANVFFDFLQQPTWRVTDERWSTSNIVVQEQELVNIDSAPRLTATLENRSLRPISDIEVIALLYNRAGNAVSASKTYVPMISQNSTADVFFTWPGPFPEEVVQVEVIPRINPFTIGNQ